MDIDMGEGFNGSKRRNERTLPIRDGTVRQNLEKKLEQNWVENLVSC